MKKEVKVALVVSFVSLAFLFNNNCSVDEKKLAVDSFDSNGVNFDFDATETEDSGDQAEEGGLTDVDGGDSGAGGKDAGKQDGTVSDSGDDAGDDLILCVEDSDCPSGFYCDYKCYKGSGSECFDNEDCPTGEECKAFRCRSQDIPDGEKDGKCFSDLTCNEGLVCENGYCVETTDGGVSEDTGIGDSGGTGDDSGSSADAVIEDTGSENDGGGSDTGTEDTGCVDKCANEGLRICYNQSSYMACQRGEDGCLVWGDHANCPDGDTCYDGSCVSTSCNLGDRRCNSKILEECKKRSDGKLVWETVENCTDACQNGACVCIPTCENKDCGDDGCGSSCGDCDTPPAAFCEGSKVKSYEGSGTCESNNQCSYAMKEVVCSTTCIADPLAHCDNCTPNCTGKCGGASDGCGGSCTASCGTGKVCIGEACVACGGSEQPCCSSNACDTGYACVSGVCKSTCTPDCSNKCGGAPDGCSGTCTAPCDVGEICVSQACIACGDATQPCCDGGVCDAPNTCGGGGTSGVCGCTPDCANKCGGVSDGCGGTCTASCPSNYACQNGTCVRQCPSGYTLGTFNNHCYKLSSNKYKWDEGFNGCKNAGAHLVTITSQGEENQLLQMFNWDWAWIGGRDSGSEGKWYWITSEPWSFSHWCGGEPNNWGGDEDYAAWTKGSNCWNDANDREKYYIICEVD